VPAFLQLGVVLAVELADPLGLLIVLDKLGISLSEPLPTSWWILDLGGRAPTSSKACDQASMCR
jgi:hypothetical protein